MTKAKAAPKRDRSGYYRTPVGTFLSVTTILNKGVPKEALMHWSAKEVAQCAVDNLPRLARARGRLARAEAVDWLRRAAENKRDHAATLGSAIHKAVEAEVLGSPRPAATDEQQPFLDAFANFVADHRPRFEATELVVAHPEHGWAGTADAWAYLPQLDDVLVLIDWKSGRGVYDEAAWQLSAYIRATHGWLRDGTEVTPPAADRAVVVHLRPESYERGYAVVPADTSDASYAEFRAAQAVAARRMGLIGEPLVPPDMKETA